MSCNVHRYFFFAGVLLVCIGIVTPPEWVRVQERRFVGQLVTQGHLDIARALYGAMAYVQRDAVGSHNYHVLKWANAVPVGGKRRKQASILADRAWRKAGKRGVAAAYWNLAMFNIKHGRKSSRRDRNTTGWLRWAARAGIPDARTLLDAGPKEYDRIRVLMTLGHRGAAATMASVMWHQNQKTKSIEALTKAASGGHVASMARLGFLIASEFNGEDADRAKEAEKWLTRAADSGHVLAAFRLGQCHAEPTFFCKERDPLKAHKWFERAMQPYPKFQAPELNLDSQFAIRLGVMARWYVDQSDIAGDAQREIDAL